MKQTDQLSLALVLPRYGASLGGGAEALVRSYVLGFSRGLFSRGPLSGPLSRGPLSQWKMPPRIEVWTTCALDHRTWDNHFEPGQYNEDGITVHRFPVDNRDIETFLKHELALQGGWPLGIEAQLEWLASSVNSKALYRHIALHANEFDLLLFAPYLFPTSVWGPLICPERSVLLPCLHDEKYAYQEVFKYLFSKVRGVLFNAEPEKQLAAELYALPDLEEKSAVVGMAFDELNENPQDLLEVLAQIQSRVGSSLGNYILYSGRKEQGKNLDLLLDCFEALPDEAPFRDLNLVIMGAGDIHFREALPARVTDLGFVSESEKSAILSHALCLVQPSVNESFSIVIMEAWLRGVPVIVHSNCAVTRHHAVQSGGGLYFENAGEFRLVLDCMLKDPSFRTRLGESGRRYVSSRYSWEAVGKRLEDFFSVMQARE